MVEFTILRSGTISIMRVKVNEQGLGRTETHLAGSIDRLGHFCPTHLPPTVRLHPDDMRVIAQKGEEVKVYGIEPPVCDKCGGTPMFPRSTVTDVGVLTCAEEIHPVAE